MTAAITLATPDHAAALLALMARSHEERAMPFDDAHRTKVVKPLLDGNPLGAVWLIGPARAPLGYVIISFGWSVAQGGMIGWVEDVFVRNSVRRRGIGTEVVHAVSVTLKKSGVRSLQARIGADDTIASQFCRRVGFRDDAAMQLLTETL